MVDSKSHQSYKGESNTCTHGVTTELFGDVLNIQPVHIVIQQF